MESVHFLSLCVCDLFSECIRFKFIVLADDGPLYVSVLMWFVGLRTELAFVQRRCWRDGGRSQSRPNTIWTFVVGYFTPAEHRGTARDDVPPRRWSDGIGSVAVEVFVVEFYEIELDAIWVCVYEPMCGQWEFPSAQHSHTHVDTFGKAFALHWSIPEILYAYMP